MSPHRWTYVTVALSALASNPTLRARVFELPGRHGYSDADVRRLIGRRLQCLRRQGLIASRAGVWRYAAGEARAQ